ncbi:MAG: hypothetical protein PUB90_00025, partial [bacterium]|nr:hypothetical protein [bacterium]
LLAVIVVLALILVITFPNLTNVFKNSKLKNEQIFVDRLSQTIDSYVSLNSDQITFEDYGTGTKTGSNGTVSIYKGTITVQNIINDKIITAEDYINPGNKEVQCNKNAEIEVYRDSDYVYCHKVKKDALDCLSKEFKDSITGDYVIDTCVWEKQ